MVSLRVFLGGRSVHSAVHSRCILDLEYTFNLGAVHSVVYS